MRALGKSPSGNLPNKPEAQAKAFACASGSCCDTSQPLARPINNRTKLPAILRELFWQYRFASLSWERDQDLVTQRILVHGTWPAIQWLRSKLGNSGIRDWIAKREGRGLSRRQLRFWEVILDLPRREVNRWLADESRVIWDRRCAQ